MFLEELKQIRLLMSDQTYLNRNVTVAPLSDKPNN